MDGEPSLQSSDDTPFKLTWNPGLIVDGPGGLTVVAASVKLVLVCSQLVAALGTEQLSPVEVIQHGHCVCNRYDFHWLPELGDEVERRVQKRSNNAQACQEVEELEQ